MISFYNAEVDRLLNTGEIAKDIDIDNFINTDKTRISWTEKLKKDLNKGKKHNFHPESIYSAMYRPFFKQWAYFSRDMNERVFQMPSIFPKPDVRNRVIVTTRVGSKGGFSVLMTDCVPDLNIMAAGAQCFPLKLYEKAENLNGELFENQRIPKMIML